jgi:glycosyltransferase involved in cell wall biosynthesis
MDRAEPLVSIVLPTYNRQRMLSGAIESCQNQTYQNIEIIIVNDGSIDDTEKMVKKLIEKDSRIKYYKKINEGLPKALNYGFQYARGKYFTWTSDDNLYDKEALMLMVSALEENKEVKLVYSNYILIDEDGKELGKYESPEPSKIFEQSTVGACFLYDSKCAKKVGEYDSSWSLVEDSHFFLRFAQVYDIMKLTGVSPYYYRIFSESLTTTRYIEIQCLNSKLYALYTEGFWQKLGIYSKGYYDCALWILKKSKSKSLGIKYILYALLLQPFSIKNWFLFARLILPKGFKQLFKQEINYNNN